MTTEEVLQKVKDASLMSMNFACWEDDYMKSGKLWKMTFCIKDCIEKLKEIMDEDSTST
jgi:hypothetical protein